MAELVEEAKLTVEERRGYEPNEYLQKLRAEFPGVGFVADPTAGRWMAVVPHRQVVRAGTGIELRERMMEVFGRPR